MSDIRDLAALSACAVPLQGGVGDFDPLLQSIGDARLVLLGEATHGTHEFYRTRAELTKRLIAEKGFRAVAIEGDWPDAHRVHRYVVASSGDSRADLALAGFERFPQWMWRNTDVLAFVEWLRAHNEARQPPERVGFFGLDLYSLYASIDAVLESLKEIDPAAAARASHRYSCFDPYVEAEQYGRSAALGLEPSCEEQVTAQLIELQSRVLRRELASGGSGDELFSAEQNARVIKNAEEYYRHMFGEMVSTWNLRDQHMVDTLDAIAEHLEGRRIEPKIVVWAHNSHVGDARATQMAQSGECNIGQLARERHPRDTFLVGFSTYEGTVTAATDWGAVAERQQVRPALTGSWEALLHAVGLPAFAMVTGRVGTLGTTHRLSRAIGVVYRPQTERRSHYLESSLLDQFDAVIHVDRTRAVEPLERFPSWDAEVPETYPFAV